MAFGALNVEEEVGEEEGRAITQLSPRKGEGSLNSLPPQRLFTKSQDDYPEGDGQGFSQTPVRPRPAPTGRADAPSRTSRTRLVR